MLKLKIIELLNNNKKTTIIQTCLVNQEMKQKNWPKLF